MKKQSIIVVCVVLLLLTLSIGYSVFKTSTTVIGSSNIVKDLNVVFSEVGKIEEVGSENATAIIMPDKKTVIINVPKLMYKGSYVVIPITIKNIGNIPARLNYIYEHSISNQNAITVSYDGIGVTDSALKPNDEVNFNVRISWANDVIKDSDSIQFVIKFNYVQV